MHAVLRMTQKQIQRFARSSNAVHDSPDWKAGRTPDPKTQEFWLSGNSGWPAEFAISEIVAGARKNSNVN